MNLKGTQTITVDKAKKIKIISFLLDGSEIGKLEYFPYENNPSYPKNSLYISSIMVDKEYRGNGIAGKLIEKAIEIAKKDKRNVIFLETNTSNTAMQTAAKKLKFKETLRGEAGFLRMELDLL